LNYEQNLTSLFTHKLSPVEQAEIVICFVELFVTVEHELPDLPPKEDAALAAEPGDSENSHRRPF